jgi:hypothetical protein
LSGTDGAWRYLRTFDGFRIDTREVGSDPGMTTPTTFATSVGVAVSAVAVPHGIIPALAYRIEADGHPPPAQLAGDADLLVHDMAPPERGVPHSQPQAPSNWTECGHRAEDLRTFPVGSCVEPRPES